MKNAKRILSLVCAGMLSTSIALTTGCKKEAPNDPQTLEIYIGNFGYGIEWLNNIIENFKKEDWVQSKYPKLNIPKVQSNSNKGYPIDQVTSGKTTIDLLFSTLSATGSLSQAGKDNKSHFEEMSDLYDMTIPGENVTVADKMHDMFLETYKVKVGNKQGYYMLPWAEGPLGLFYNQAVVKDKLGADYALPKTTEELKQMCEDLKSGTDKKTPFIFCASEDYERYLLNSWWAQYEGYENYERFWYGVDKNNVMSSSIFEQKGRLEALTALEELIGNASGNAHKDVNILSFTQAQTGLIDGTGVLQTNGDWLQREMSVIASESQLNNVSMMKTPIISSMVEQLELYTHDVAYSELSKEEKAAYDAQLSAIIEAVDNGESSLAGVTQSDFERVKEARSMVYLIGGHDAFIPAYSTAKDLAKDFLAYMVSDKGINTYMKTTKGCSMPYNYDVETQDPALYATFTDMQKEKLSILKNGTLLPLEEKFELSYLGQVRSYNVYENITFCFTAQNPNDYHTALEVYNADITYYTKSQGYEWNNALKRMGIM